MAAFDTTRTHYGSHTFAGRIGSTISSMVGSFSSWNDARMTRNALNRLSNRELEDIGLVRGDIDLIAHNQNFR